MSNPSTSINNPVQNRFRGHFSQSAGATDGAVRDLGYSLQCEYKLTFSDLALFKTREASKYRHQMELILGPEFDDITLDDCLNQIEQNFPNIDNWPAQPRCSLKAFYELIGIKDYRCIDYNGQHYAVAADLNYPLEEKSLLGTFDLVTDYGCNEHVFNVSQAYKRSSPKFS